MGAAAVVVLLRYFHPSVWFTERAARRNLEVNVLRLLIALSLSRSPGAESPLPRVCSMRWMDTAATGLPLWAADGNLTMKSIVLLSAYGSVVSCCERSNYAISQLLTPLPPRRRTLQGLRTLRTQAVTSMLDPSVAGRAGLLEKLDTMRRKLTALIAPDFWLALTVVLSARPDGGSAETSIGAQLVEKLWVSAAAPPHGAEYEALVLSITGGRPVVLQFLHNNAWVQVNLNTVLLAERTHQKVFATAPLFRDDTTTHQMLLTLITKLHHHAFHFRGVSYSAAAARRAGAGGGGAAQAYPGPRGSDASEMG